MYGYSTKDGHSATITEPIIQYGKKWYTSYVQNAIHSTKQKKHL